MNSPRVRIAPSPTGFLHVGTARIALANYLFARKNNGKFILRIEDTDLERSENQYIQNIFDGLRALGLNWDEGPESGGEHGPYIQSQRLDLYKQKAQELLDKGLAYRCYCTQEELDKEKDLAKTEKRLFVYSGKCCNLSKDDESRALAEGRKATIRFKVPHKVLTFQDIIKGELTFETPLIGDFVILKSNGTPTYNFAVVVDDIDMEITHIIRGEDHISNTPRQVLLYEAFDKPVPQFAHMAMILAADKTKLSKRHGATAVSEFIEDGYLPEAFVNFLALLGWSSPDGEEVKTLDQLTQLFELDRVSPSPAIFDKEKLDWLNGVYLRTLPLEDITNRAKKYLQKYALSMYSEDKLRLMVKEFRERITTLSEITAAVYFFFDDEIIMTDNTREEALIGLHVPQVLQKFYETVEAFDFNNLEILEAQFKDFRKSLKPLKPKDIMMPVRAALTGELHGPDLTACIYLLGKETVKARVKTVLNDYQ